MMKIIEIQRKVISEELMKAKKKAKKSTASPKSTTASPKATATASPVTSSPSISVHPPQPVNNERSEKIRKEKVKQIMDEMTNLSHLNEKLQFAEESVDRLEIAVKQQLHTESGHGNGQAEGNLIHNHLACAKTEVSRLRSANDHAAVEVKDNQKALDKMEEAKAERKLALKR